MKRHLLLGGLLALILIGGGIYALCIPCQYFEYRSLPSVDEVLANRIERPEPIGTIEVFEWDDSPLLCIEINMVDLMTRDTRKSIYEDFALQITSIRERYYQSKKLFIDNYRQIVSLYMQMGEFQESFCADVGGFKIGRHVAFVTVQAPSGQEYSYTWVFEITEDEIIPLVS